MSQTDTEHQHDLVRVEDEGAGLAWDKCRTCPHRSEPEPWAPMTVEEVAEFNARRTADGNLVSRDGWDDSEDVD